MRAIDVHCHLNTEKGIASFTPEEKVLLKNAQRVLKIGI